MDEGALEPRLPHPDNTQHIDQLSRSAVCQVRRIPHRRHQPPSGERDQRHQRHSQHQRPDGHVTGQNQRQRRKPPMQSRRTRSTAAAWRRRISVWAPMPDHRHPEEKLRASEATSAGAPGRIPTAADRSRGEQSDNAPVSEPGPNNTEIPDRRNEGEPAPAVLAATSSGRTPASSSTSAREPHKRQAPHRINQNRPRQPNRKDDTALTHTTAEAPTMECA